MVYHPLRPNAHSAESGEDRVALTTRKPVNMILSVALLGFIFFPAGVAASQRMPIVSSTDRTPVLLVPGWGDEAEEVRPLRRRLAEAGWSVTHLSVLTFSDPYGSNEAHVPEIAVAVDRMRQMTGVERIDIVAHSMGGLAVRRFLTRESDHGVRRVVFLGTPHHGTVAARLAWGEGAAEMIPESDFLLELNDPARSANGTEMLAIRSPLDLVVIPNSSAVLSGAENLEVCCPTHQGLLDDPQTFIQIEGFLLHGSDGLSTPEDPLLWREIRSRIPTDRDQ